MTTLKSVEEALTFPHQDDNNWLEIEVGGVKRPQYPSPLEVKMMIEADRQATADVLCALLEEIETMIDGDPEMLVEYISKREAQDIIRKTLQAK